VVAVVDGFLISMVCGHRLCSGGIACFGVDQIGGKRDFGFKQGTYWRSSTHGRYGEVTSSRSICKIGGRVAFHFWSSATIFALST
jgi:hypothetical protein